MIIRIHIYLGLLSFAHFLVYGIAGLTAAAQTQPERPKLTQSSRTVPFTAGPSLTDKQVAEAVYRTLNLPFTRPMPDWFLKRTAEHHLLLDFYNINGIYRVTVLEDAGQLRIDQIRNNPWLFLEDMHAATGEDGGHFQLIRIWGAYNQFAMWTLIGMALSGFLIWLRSNSRPFRLLRDAHLVTGLSALPFLMIFAVSAVQMTHRSWFPMQPSVSQTQITEPAGLDNARALAASLMSRGLVQGEIDFAQSTPAGLRVRVSKPGATFDVDYDRANGRANIRTSALASMAVLNRLHHTAGLWHGYWMNQVWNGLLAVVSLGLIWLGATGLWLWFERRRERAIGLVLLSVNLGFSITVLALIRYH